MAVVSAKHNGHSVRQRVVVTLICLTLATTLVSSISLYVDSASVDEWNQEIEVGPVSMMVSGEGIEDVLDEISEIPGVTNVSGLDSAHGYLARKNVIYYEDIVRKREKIQSDIDDPTAPKYREIWEATGFDGFPFLPTIGINYEF